MDLLQEGKHREAYTTLLALIKNDTTNVKAYLKLGEVLRSIGKPAKALKVHKSLLIRKDMTNYESIELYKNLVAALALPVTYPLLTQALYRAQEYVKRNPNNDKSVPSKTRLFRSLVGQSDQIQAVRKLVEKVAPSDANVLILGESGTGKEVIARNIHFLSNRKDSEFIPINCGAIPGELLESELFGHEKGAFTGAVSSRKGRFELAEGGTLFLDEIGDMPLQMQVKLLRVLQERTFERVGGTRPINCNVRVIAATHRNLESMIEQDKFREDLYYRLNVFPIESPALRERQEDIPLLLQELVTRIQDESETTVRFTEPAIRSLMEHPWPGNVRELDNVVQRALILHQDNLIEAGDLLIENFDTAIVTEVEAIPERHEDKLGNELKQQEHQIILDTLHACQGSRKAVAERLGISPRTLRYKLAKMRDSGIQIPA